jgi:hypothetical protein
MMASPDGAECIACGDRCFIRQVELILAADDGGTVLLRSGFFKCGACAEMGEQ